MKNGVEIQKNLLLITSMWSSEKINRINKEEKNKSWMEKKRKSYIYRGDLKKISTTAINLKT